MACTQFHSLFHCFAVVNQRIHKIVHFQKVTSHQAFGSMSPLETDTERRGITHCSCAIWISESLQYLLRETRMKMTETVGVHSEVIIGMNDIIAEERT
jgi:hypothetical protein